MFLNRFIAKIYSFNKRIGSVKKNWNISNQHGSITFNTQLVGTTVLNKKNIDDYVKTILQLCLNILGIF